MGSSTMVKTELEPKESGREGGSAVKPIAGQRSTARRRRRTGKIRMSVIVMVFDYHFNRWKW